MTRILYVPTDNLYASGIGIIDNIFRPAKVSVCCGEEGICQGCGEVDDKLLLS